MNLNNKLTLNNNIMTSHKYTIKAYLLNIIYTSHHYIEHLLYNIYTILKKHITIGRVIPILHTWKNKSWEGQHIRTYLTAASDKKSLLHSAIKCLLFFPFYTAVIDIPLWFAFFTHTNIWPFYYLKLLKELKVIIAFSPYHCRTIW